MQAYNEKGKSLIQHIIVYKNAYIFPCEVIMAMKNKTVTKFLCDPEVGLTIILLYII